MTALAEPLQKVPGFEATGYALLRGRIVWAGEATRHPRCLHHPWRPRAASIDAACLRAGAAACLARLDALPPKGLLLWLAGRPLPFPLDAATPRFDAVRDALARRHLADFEAAALRVLGLGIGLTPCGDDFLGGALFALHHVPLPAWQSGWRTTLDALRDAALTRTNVISTALLDDLMAGASHAELHELLVALQTDSAQEIEAACRALLRIGASSGADLLAGVLVALTTSTSDQNPEPSP